ERGRARVVEHDRPGPVAKARRRVHEALSLRQGELLAQRQRRAAPEDHARGARRQGELGRRLADHARVHLRAQAKKVEHGLRFAGAPLFQRRSEGQGRLLDRHLRAADRPRLQHPAGEDGRRAQELQRPARSPLEGREDLGRRRELRTPDRSGPGMGKAAGGGVSEGARGASARHRARGDAADADAGRRRIPARDLLHAHGRVVQIAGAARRLGQPRAGRDQVRRHSARGEGAASERRKALHRFRALTRRAGVVEELSPCDAARRSRARSAAAHQGLQAACASPGPLAERRGGVEALPADIRSLVTSRALSAKKFRERSERIMEAANKNSTDKVGRFSDAPRRIDLKAKVTGRAQFIEDLPDLPGTIYAAALLSPYSHARILSIDASEALAMPGVLGVVDREHLDGVNPRLKLGAHDHFKLPDDQDFVAIKKVRYDGDLVAVIAAEDLATAERALQKIHVEYEPLAPVFDAVEALAPGAPILHEERGTNLLLEDSLIWGDVEEGFRAADRVFEETYSSPSMFHHPMEPIGGCLMHYLNGEVNVWLPTASPMRDAGEFAHFLGLEAGKVRLRVPYVGGGFGSKIPTTAHYAVLLLTRRLQRPVRLVPSEEYSFRQN